MGIVLAVLLSAGSASALTVNVLPSSPGLDQGFGFVCTPNCTETYGLSTPAAVAAGGTITFAGNLVGPTDVVSISLLVPSSLFAQSPSGPDTVTFSALAYTGSLNASVTPLGGGLVLVSQTDPGSGTIVGSLTATAGGSGPVSLGSVDVNSFTCILDGANQGTCGLTFGITGFGVTIGGTPTQFQHTFNLVLPEPTALALLLAGLAALGFCRGRAR
jgi:hypothetical protein